MKQAGQFIIFLLIPLFFFVFSIPAGAHSGRTDSNGGHNCNVGACAGTYHYHNGGSAPVQQPQTPIYIPEPTVYILPTSAPTVVPFRRATIAPTKKLLPTKKPTIAPTKKPTPTFTVTPTATITPTLTTVPMQKAIEVQQENEKGFWSRLFDFLF